MLYPKQFDLVSVQLNRKSSSISGNDGLRDNSFGSCNPLPSPDLDIEKGFRQGFGRVVSCTFTRADTHHAGSTTPSEVDRNAVPFEQFSYSSPLDYGSIPGKEIGRELRKSGYTGSAGIHSIIEQGMILRNKKNIWHNIFLSGVRFSRKSLSLTTMNCHKEYDFPTWSDYTREVKNCFKSNVFVLL